MHRHHRHRPILALVSLAALAACDPILQPVLVGDAYVLETAPAVLSNDAVRVELLADTLWLAEDGSARRVTRQRMDFVEFPDTTLSTDLPYRYTVRGDRIELEQVCPPNALCTPPPHIWGRTTAGGLDLRMANDPRPVLRYRRVHR